MNVRYALLLAASCSAVSCLATALIVGDSPAHNAAARPTESSAKTVVPALQSLEQAIVNLSRTVSEVQRTDQAGAFC